MGDRKSYVAVYSAGEDLSSLMDEITNILEEQGKNVQISDDVDKFRDVFIILELKNLGEANALVTTTCGKEMKNGTSILCGIVNPEKMEDMFDILIQALKTRATETAIDLGDLKALVNAPLDAFGIGSFISLVAAAYCAQNETRKAITRISFNNNGITKGFFFFALKNLFPHLKKIAVLGNPISNQAEFISTMKTRNKIKLITKLEDMDFALSTTIIESSTFLDDAYLGSLFIPTDPRLVQFGSPELRGRIELPSITDYQPCGIDPDEFPTNQFIINFLEDSWLKLASISQYYDPSAKFSVTVKDCGPGSPLEKFTKFSRDILKNSSNCIFGSDIVDAQKEIFIQGFYAYPTQIESVMLDEDLYSVIIHGVFQSPYLSNSPMKEKQVICFDRTLVIKDLLKKHVITNDHIYMHNPPVYE